jgi:hypothetical protein
VQYISIYFLKIIQAKSDWNIVFFIAAFIYLIGAVIFLLIGTGETQPWASHPADDLNDHHHTETALTEATVGSAGATNQAYVIGDNSSTKHTYDTMQSNQTPAKST